MHYNQILAYLQVFFLRQNCPKRFPTARYIRDEIASIKYHVYRHKGLGRLRKGNIQYKCERMARNGISHEGLWQQLIRLNRQETAKRAKCEYISNPESYIVTLLNSQYVVNLEDRKIFSSRNCSQSAEFLEQLCILAYLINAQDLPPANKLVKPETLPGGQFFFRGVHCLPTEKLQKAFGQHPERLSRIAERFGAKNCEFGDDSIQLYILPRIPLTVVVWGSDDQFDARASILFDQTASAHLPLDALLAAVNLAVDTLIETCKQSG